MDEQQWRNEATLDAPDSPAAVTTVPITASKPKRHIPWLWVWIGMGLLILGTSVLIILWLRQTVTKTQANNKANQVKVQNVDLSSISGNSSSIDLNTADKVVVNGQLQSNDGVVLKPTSQPSAGTLGQIYVDKTTNEVRYYNGQTFVTLATDTGNLCNKNDAACGFATQTQVAALISATSSSSGNVTSLQGQTGPLSLVGTGGLTISGNSGNISLNLPQNLTVTANPIFAGMTISNLTGNSIVATDANSTLQAITPVAPGLCLLSTSGLPTFGACVGGGFSVSSLDGLTGALILANSSGSGSTVTIDDASTSAKGIAQFNATNFTASSGVINTIQDIATTSTPTFAGVLTNTIDRASAGTLTLGATNATAISLNQDTTIANSKNLTVSGGNISQTGTGSLSTGTGTISLNGATTVAANKQFTANGIALFRDMTNESNAFQVQNAGGAVILGVDSTSTANGITTNSSFDAPNPNVWSSTPGPGVCTTPAKDQPSDPDPTPDCVLPWVAMGAPTPTPTTFNRDDSSSIDISSGSLHIVNNGSSVQGAAYPVVLTAGTYTINFYARSNASTQSLKIGYYTGSDLSSRVEQCTTSSYNLPNPANTLQPWKNMTCTLTVSGTAAGIYFRSTKSNGDWNLDRVILETGSVFKPLNNGLINANAATTIAVDSDSAFKVQSTTGTYPILNVDTNIGTVLFRPRTNDTNALQVQNADGSVVFNIKAGVAGNVSSWKLAANQISSTSPFGRQGFQPAVATTSSGDSYVYAITSSNNAPSVQYAKLNGNGGEIWYPGTTTGLPETIYGGTVFAKGYIYVVGGTDGTTSRNTVYYNKVASDGSLEWPSWQLSPQTMSVARGRFQAAYYNGYIYAVGGSTSINSAGSNTVERAQVHADGTISAWIPDTSYPFGIRAHAVSISAGYIYVMGGLVTGGVGNEVYYAQIAGNGSLGSWTPAESLPNAGTNVQSTVVGGYVYAFPGASGTFYFAALSAGGGLDGSWSTGNIALSDGTLIKRNNAGAFSYNDILYYLGGTTANPGRTWGTVYYAAASGNSTSVSIDGALSVSRDATFSGTLQVTPLNNNTSAFQVANSSGGQVLNVDTQNNVVTLNGTNSGELHNWLTTTPLNSANAGHGSASLNGYVYVVSGGTSKKVSYAKIKTDGSLASWTDNAVDLPDYKNFNAVIASNGYIYVVGGYDSSGSTPSNVIYYGKPAADGSISAWRTSSTNLQTGVASPAISVFNGYLYVVGGATGALSSGKPTLPTDKLQSAKLNADGSLGTFTEHTVNGSDPQALPAARMGGRSAVANGYLYFTGGDSGSGAQTSMYYAQLTNTGGVVGWTVSSMNAARAYHTAFILNGYLYTMGGTSGDYLTNSLDTIDYGKLESDGSISQWTSNVQVLLDTVQSHSTVVANGYIYVIGGYNTANSSTVMFSTASRVAIGGSLDLVGLGSRTLSDAGGGGELTAGNTSIVGTLDVRNAANFTQSLAVNGTFTAHDDVLLQSDSNSTNAFQVQNSSGTVLLGVNASAGQVNVNADMLFGNTNSISVNSIKQTANGQNLSIDAGNDVISFTAGGRTFIFPTTGPSSQTICTTGISCASGGGQAVLLAIGTVQTNNTADPDIFINSTSTGKHLQLQSGGVNVFTVDNNGKLTLGTPGSVGGQVVFSDGTSAYSITLNTTTLTGNRTITFPDAAGQICLTSGNCAGSGTGVTATTPGTTNTIAKFTGAQDLGNSNITDDGTTVAIQGANGLVLGTNAITGQLKLKSGAYSVLLQPSGLTADRTINLPDVGGTICTSAGNCFGSGTGNTLQAAYDAGSSITTSDANNITFTLADTATDSSFVVNIQGTGNQIKFQDGGTDVFNVSDGGVFTLKSTSNSSSALVLQNSSNTALLTADASAMKLKLGTGTPTLGAATSGGLYVTDAAEFAGQILVGTASNGAAFDASSHQLRFTGSARNTKTLQLNPEYVGAVLNGTGIGTMTADICSGTSRLSINTSVCASTETYNYYSWTTSQASSQTYNIYVQMKMPSDFDGFSSNSSIGMYGWRTTSSDVVELSMYNASGALCGSATTVSTSNTAWTLTSLTGNETSDSACVTGTGINPDDVITFKVRLTSATGEFARAGAIRFSYNSKF